MRILTIRTPWWQLKLRVLLIKPQLATRAAFNMCLAWSERRAACGSRNAMPHRLPGNDADCGIGHESGAARLADPEDCPPRLLDIEQGLFLIIQMIKSKVPVFFTGTFDLYGDILIRFADFSDVLANDVFLVIC